MREDRGLIADQAILQPAQAGFFLFGPRGAGKSTWLAQQFPQALPLDLLAPEVLRAYLARAERIAPEPDAHTGLIADQQAVN